MICNHFYYDKNVFLNISALRAKENKRVVRDWLQAVTNTESKISKY